MVWCRVSPGCEDEMRTEFELMVLSFWNRDGEGRKKEKRLFACMLTGLGVDIGKGVM